MTYSSSQKSGVLSAIAAYTMWGVAPIYFKLLQAVPANEILVHRIVWSFAFLALIVVAARMWHKTRLVLQNPKLLGLLVLTSLILAVNWLIFIWAVNSNNILDASLGYYINPIFSVALGMVFFAERLRRLQWLAVGLAIIGVIVQLVSFGEVPVIALALALTFGTYGMLRKKLPVDSITGLFLESLVVLPLALIYWIAFADSEVTNMTMNSWQMNTILIAAGLVTTLPLLCFTAAAKRLQLSTLGFFQYIGPSLMFLLAVFFYGERFSEDKAVTFGFIWTALFIYVVDALRHQKIRRK